MYKIGASSELSLMPVYAGIVVSYIRSLIVKRRPIKETHHSQKRPIKETYTCSQESYTRD